MYKCIEDYKQIEHILNYFGVLAVGKKEGKTVLIIDELPVSVEVLLPCCEIDEKFISFIALSENEGESVLSYFVCGEDSESPVEKSVSARDMKATLIFRDYGPVEKESATAAEFIELCCNGAVFKNRAFGEELLNDAERQLIEYKDYIFLLQNVDYLNYIDVGVFENARKKIPDGTPLASAVDGCICENYGLAGKRNRKRLKKELAKHIDNEFDSDFFVSLCKAAVKDFKYSFDVHDDRYEAIKKTVTELLKKKGFSGKYPLFEKGEKYVRFGVCRRDEYADVCARFGISGDRPKKFFDPVGISDMLPLVSFYEEAPSDNLEMFIDGIVNILEGEKVSKEFKKHTVPAEGKLFYRGIAGFLVVFSLCGISAILSVAAGYSGGFFEFFAYIKSLTFGIIFFCLLLGYGVYLLAGGIKGSYLISDKGDKI